MNLRLSYACPLDGTYAVESAIPVSTCSTNARKVALPNTYHHPVRGGTGCSSARRAAVRRPLRSSSQASRRLSTEVSGDRNGAGLDLDLAGGRVHPHRILRQRARRRPRGDGTVTVVHAAVAGTEEQLCVGHPAYRAAEVSAVHREGRELPLAVAAE